MLRHRLLLGTLFAAALVGLCWADGAGLLGAPPYAWLFPLALLLSVLASGELLRLFSAREERAAAWLVYVGNIAIVASNAVPLFWPRLAASLPLDRFGWPAAAFALGTVAAFAVALRRYEPTGRPLVGAALTVLSFAYLGWMLTFIVQLRALGSTAQGMTALISLVAVVKMSDTGAFTVGRWIGRHKMTPVLSPGKTWEGVAGGLLFGILGAWFVFCVFRTWIGATPSEALPAWRWIVFAIVVTIAGMLGDLAESLIKRDAGRKDSSAWMIGLGGVLDVIDSLLLAAPVAYLCWAAGLVF